MEINPRPTIPETSPLPLLTDDILLEILSRLPVKSLLRFRCVSKSWYALISSTTSKKLLPPAMAGLFFNGEYIHNKNQFIGLRSRTYIDASSIDTALSFLPSTHPASNLRILDCCNGLLLLSNIGLSLIVCNPATRRWAHISNPPTNSRKLVLAFDPHRSTHYKIISFPLPPHDPTCPWGSEEVEVFSSETGEWRDIKGIRDLAQIRFANTRIVFLNGILYILDVYNGRTFTVDLQGKECRRINSPYDLAVWINRQYVMYAHCFGVSEGRLHFAFILSGEMHVWVLEDSCNNDYIVKHRTSIHAILKKLPGSRNLQYSHVDIAAFHPDRDLIFLQSQGMLFSYHLVNSDLEWMFSVSGEQPFFAYSPCYSEDLDL